MAKNSNPKPEETKPEAAPAPRSGGRLALKAEIAALRAENAELKAKLEKANG